MSYLALLKLCSDKLSDCKFQIMQLTSQIDNIFTTLYQSNPNARKEVLFISCSISYLETQIVLKKLMPSETIYQH